MIGVDGVLDRKLIRGIFPIGLGTGRSSTSAVSISGRMNDLFGCVPEVSRAPTQDPHSR